MRPASGHLFPCRPGSFASRVTICATPSAHYRAIPPPKVGRQLAARIVGDFKQAVRDVEAMPLAHQEHPDIPGVRLVHFVSFPYFAFYLVDGPVVVVIAVEHDASDYAARVLKRAAAATP